MPLGWAELFRLAPGAGGDNTDVRTDARPRAPRDLHDFRPRLTPLDTVRSALYNADMNERAHESQSLQLIAALHAVQLRLEAALEPLGLSLAKFGCLSKLVAAGEPLPLGTLAERCACVRSNITQLVDRLEAEKLVIRADDPEDRRSVRAELTAEGRARHAAGLSALEAAERELFSRLPRQQRESLLQLLRSLTGRS